MTLIPKPKKSVSIWLVFSLILFIFVTISVVKKSPWVNAFDLSISKAVRSFASPGLTKFTLIFTSTLNPLQTTVIVLLISGTLFYFKKKWQSIFLLTNSLIIGFVINTLAKIIIARPRPGFKHLIHVSSYSYPSGHAMGAMLLFGSLIIIINSIFKKSARIALVNILLGMLIVLIGISRIYINVHYATDILGDWSLGYVCLVISYWVFFKIGVKKNETNTKRPSNEP